MRHHQLDIDFPGFRVTEFLTSLIFLLTTPSTAMSPISTRVDIYKSRSIEILQTMKIKIDQCSSHQQLYFSITLVRHLGSFILIIVGNLLDNKILLTMETISNEMRSKLELRPLHHIVCHDAAFPKATIDFPKIFLMPFLDK